MEKSYSLSALLPSLAFIYDVKSTVKGRDKHTSACILTYIIDIVAVHGITVGSIMKVVVHRPVWHTHIQSVTLCAYPQAVSPVAVKRINSVLGAELEVCTIEIAVYRSRKHRAGDVLQYGTRT